MALRCPSLLGCRQGCEAIPERLGQPRRQGSAGLAPAKPAQSTRQVRRQAPNPADNRPKASHNDETTTMANRPPVIAPARVSPDSSADSPDGCAGQPRSRSRCSQYRCCHNVPQCFTSRRRVRKFRGKEKSTAPGNVGFDQAPAGGEIGRPAVKSRYGYDPATIPSP